MRKILTTFLMASLFMVACKNSTPDSAATSDVPVAPTNPSTELPTIPTTAATVPVTGQQATANSQVLPPSTAKSEPAQNVDGVWHYTCTKGCKGGAGAASPCAKCGTTLTHNAAYHAVAPPPVQTTIGNQTVPTTASATTAPPQKVEPAQNAKGVWHYTCAKGCAGGGGAAGPCGKCGGTLAHNAVYHQ